MNSHYTTERNVQILISVLKANNIKNVVASPGTTNICFIASIQQDPFFTIYSAPDERSAGYIACGMAAETGEPVVISCTGATASRNYMPALTEAYYRKLPILAITSSRRSSKIGHNYDQVTDRTQLPKDIAKLSVQMPVVLDADNEWAVNIAANKAVLELNHRGKGPVHINLETDYSRIYDVKDLPTTRIIKRFTQRNSLPKIKASRICIFVGAHSEWSEKLTQYVDKFCSQHNAIVLCDHVSNYKGKYRAFANFHAIQRDFSSVMLNADLLIHIGDIAASCYSVNTKEVWRVNEDGEIRDPFHKLTNVFEMTEEDFFAAYTNEESNGTSLEFWNEYSKEENQIRPLLNEKLKDFPFSNAWMASQTAKKLPQNAVLHLGIQNSLRFWNFFDVPNSVLGYCNTGGFGIDGPLSTVIGAALASPQKIHYVVLGDLAFFYDFNSLGNRHLPKNIRILLVNNGRGTEFKLTGNPGAMFGDDADKYIAAAGHYGHKSKDLVKHYAEDLGFKYYSAETKDEYLSIKDKFLSTESTFPILLEAFTNSEDENQALTLISTSVTTHIKTMIREMKDFTRKTVGERGTKFLTNLMGK